MKQTDCKPRVNLRQVVKVPSAPEPVLDQMTPSPSRILSRGPGRACRHFASGAVDPPLLPRERARLAIMPVQSLTVTEPTLEDRHPGPP